MCSPIDMVKLAVSRLEKDAFTWWRQLTARGGAYELGTLEWQDFKGGASRCLFLLYRELKLRRKLQ